MKKNKESKFKMNVVQNAQRQKTQESSYGYLKLPKGVNLFKEEAGRVSLDILPYRVTDPNHPDKEDAPVGSLWYKRPYKIHRNIGADNDKVVCLSSIGKKCPICEYRMQLLKSGAKYTDEDIKALNVSVRNLYVVVPKNNKNYEEKPHIWDISQFAFQDRLNDELAEDEELGVFPDLEEGLTLKIRFTEEQIGKNKFISVSRIDFEEREAPYDESILEQVPNLDNVLDIKSYAELKALFYGAVEEKGEEIEGEEDETEEEKIEEIDEEDDEEEQEKESIKRVVKKEEVKDTKKDDDILQRKKKKIIEDDDVEEEKTVQTKKQKPTATKKNKCPYGYEFGVDTYEYSECDECDVLDDCIESSKD